MSYETKDGQKWMTVNQTSAFYGVSRRTVYNWLEMGKFEVQRTPGGSRRILVDVRGWESTGKAGAVA